MSHVATNHSSFVVGIKTKTGFVGFSNFGTVTESFPQLAKYKSREDAEKRLETDIQEIRKVCAKIMRQQADEVEKNGRVTPLTSHQRNVIILLDARVYRMVNYFVEAE